MIKKFGTKIARNNLGKKWKKDEFAQNPSTSAYYAKDVNDALGERRLEGSYETFEIFHRQKNVSSGMDVPAARISAEARAPCLWRNCHRCE
jgi:hypothetical protein